MTFLQPNHSLNESYNYLKAAWYGESPTCKLSAVARQVLDPSCYRYTGLGRVALALRGITMPLPMIGPISDKVTNYLKNNSFQTELTTAPAYMDEEFATFTDTALVLKKVQKETQSAHEKGKKKRKPLSNFAKVVQEPTSSLPTPE